MIILYLVNTLSFTLAQTLNVIFINPYGILGINNTLIVTTVNLTWHFYYNVNITFEWYITCQSSKLHIFNRCAETKNYIILTLWQQQQQLSVETGN